MEIFSSDSIKNHLLAPLPQAESQRWLPLSESVELSLGQVLYESGTTLTHVYFSDDGHHLAAAVELAEHRVRPAILI